MAKDDQHILVHTNLEIQSDWLEKIVQTAKSITGRNEKGHYQIDTADVLSGMISNFLEEKDFEGYISRIENYPAE